MFLGGHVLLAAAAAAMGAAGWRVAGRFTVEPLERAIVAATVAVCAIVAEALLLGRAGAGGSRPALAASAAATLLVARGLAGPAPTLPWWGTLGRPQRWALGAVAGTLLALVAWLLRHPALGIDATTYDLPEALGWVHRGDTGSTPVGNVEFQTGSYPLTHEVVLSWAMALSRSFAPPALWTGVSLAVLGTAFWVGLRRAGCSEGVARLALAALFTERILAEYFNKPKTDLPMLAFLAVAAALCVCAAPRDGRPGRPQLLGFALAAAGLSVGFKTTSAPVAILVLLAGLWACRRELRGAWRALSAGAVAAIGVGGVWYLRNQIAHGWFLWPFSRGPVGGDPVPIYLSRIHVSLLDRPRATLDGRVGDYVAGIGGGLVLIFGGTAAFLAARRERLVAAASALTGIALLAWASAPFTGKIDDPSLDLSLTTLRYLLPVILAGTAALALAARTSRLARAALVAAIVWNLIRTLDLGFPDVPSVWTLLGGAAAGALAAWAVGRGRRRIRLALALATVAAIGVTSRLADGWMAHAGESNATPAAPLETWFARQPGWAEDRTPVAFVTNQIGPIAGDRLRHPLELIRGDEPCAATLARLRTQWVVVPDIPEVFRRLLAPVDAPRCLAGVRAVAHPGIWLVYRQTATTSSEASRSPEPSRKSSTEIAASSGVSRRRNSVSRRS